MKCTLLHRYQTSPLPLLHLMPHYPYQNTLHNHHTLPYITMPIQYVTSPYPYYTRLHLTKPYQYKILFSYTLLNHYSTAPDNTVPTPNSTIPYPYFAISNYTVTILDSTLLNHYNTITCINTFNTTKTSYNQTTLYPAIPILHHVRLYIAITGQDSTSPLQYFTLPLRHFTSPLPNLTIPTLNGTPYDITTAITSPIPHAI